MSHAAHGPNWPARIGIALASLLALILSVALAVTLDDNSRMASDGGSTGDVLGQVVEAHQIALRCTAFGAHGVKRCDHIECLPSSRHRRDRAERVCVELRVKHLGREVGHAVQRAVVKQHSTDNRRLGFQAARHLAGHGCAVSFHKHPRSP